MAKGDKARKAAFFEKLENAFRTFDKVFLVEVDHVSSNQFHQIRIKLRGKATILMGKNTMVRRIIRKLSEELPDLESLLPYMKGNVGLCFTKEENLKEVCDMIQEDRVKAPAKPGALAPLDVFIEAQNSGMGPEKTAFFQALGIATKIVKGSIEIINRVHLIKAGDRVDPSQATLLNMLNVSPFTYGMIVRVIFEGGFVYEPKVLDITPDTLIGYLMTGANNLAAISLAASIPTVVAVPHILLNGYKNLIKISLATDYTFEAVRELKELLNDPTKLAAAAAAAAAAAPAAASSAPAAAAAAEPEPEEEEDEDMGFGLFD